MAGTPQNPPAGSPPAAPPEQTLADRIAGEAAFQDLEAQNAPQGDIDRSAEGSQQQQPVADPNADLRKQLEEIAADNKMLRATVLGMANRPQPAPQVTVQAPKPEPVAPPAPTKEQLLESLKSDPIGTIQNLARQVANETREQVTRELSGKVTESEERIRAVDQLRQGTLQYQNEFADVLNSEQGQAFDQEALRELEQMTGRDWRKVTPSSPVDAASRVYTRWVRQGKIRPIAPEAQANGNGNGGGIREIVRSQPVGGQSDRVNGSSGAPRGQGGGGEPRTLNELASRERFSSAETSAAQRIIRDSGIPEATWVAQYLASQREDSSFGRG